METINLADGTLFSGRAIQAGDVLWLYINGSSLSAVFYALEDPEHTATITTSDYGTVTEHTGYTRLFVVRDESTGTISAGLRRE